MPGLRAALKRVGEMVEGEIRDDEDWVEKEDVQLTIDAALAKGVDGYEQDDEGEEEEKGERRKRRGERRKRGARRCEEL